MMDWGIRRKLLLKLTESCMTQTKLNFLDVVLCVSVANVNFLKHII